MNDDLRDKFKKALRHSQNLPTLPGIIRKLTTMADDPNTTTEQMGRVIAKDHILAAKLLRLVNSAFYGFPQRISSLSSAIILLGFNVIKSLIISSSIFDLMESQDVQLWEHSLGCAVACSVLAKHLDISDPEEVSTAGLIHDIGKVAIKMELPNQYDAISRLVTENQTSRREAEQQLLHLDHAEAGGWLARTWNLPPKLVEPIALHHAPGQAEKEPLACAIVHFGDLLIRALGYGHGDDIWVPPLDREAWQILGLTTDDLASIIDEIEEKLWDVRGFSMELQTEPGKTPC